jgi:hypothetical protein
MQTAGRRCRATIGLLAIIAYSGFERNRDDGEGACRATTGKAERPNFPLDRKMWERKIKPIFAHSIFLSHIFLSKFSKIFA